MSAVAPAPCKAQRGRPEPGRAAFPVTASAFAIACPQQSSRERAGLLPRIDDCTRLAHVEVLNDERTESVIAFFRRGVAFFDQHGIAVQRLMTDNGPAYRSHAHAAVCRQLAIRHLFTQPYRPNTNGKAARFIRTLIGEWAYAAAYATSAARTRALPAFMNRYNHHRPHKALNESPPAKRLAERLNAAPPTTVPHRVPGSVDA